MAVQGKTAMAREPSSSGDITEQELSRRKVFLEFREEDVANLATISGVARRYADSVIENFYRHLLSFAETGTFFRDPRLRQTREAIEYESWTSTILPLQACW